MGIDLWESIIKVNPNAGNKAMPMPKGYLNVLLPRIYTGYLKFGKVEETIGTIKYFSFKF